MSEQSITFKVLRYKQGDKSPYYETFDVLCDENTTVLIALQDIRRDDDSSLMLRHSCHHASCGTCAMKINGKEELSCVVKVLDLGTSTVTVEPLDNLPLESDLVVNMDDFYAKYNAPEMSYLRESEFNPDADTPEGIGTYMRYEDCIECGICLSACPLVGSDPAYLGPAALAAAWRVVENDNGSKAQSVLDWVDNEHGCWRCHLAFECTEACPSNVLPGESIMSLRRTLTRQKVRKLFGLSK